MLDNSIKRYLIKRNITIFSDVISGFDTEYVALDFGINELLTAQLSISHTIKLSIPIFTKYTFEGVNRISNEVYVKASPKFENV